MKKFLSIVLAVLMLLSLVACGSDESKLIGKWAFGVNTYEFREDGTVSININGTLLYDGTYTVDGDKITAVVSGLLGEQTEEYTYSVKGNELTLSGDVTLTGTNLEMTFEKK